MKIKNIDLKIIKDSRDQDTLETIFETEKGSFVSSVPAGKSTGIHEAKLIRPQLALEKFSSIKNLLLGKNYLNQKEFDQFLIELDGTDDKSNLGANLILVLSMSFARAFSTESGLILHQYIEKILENDFKLNLPKSFPRPIFNVINGGAHAKNKLDFQEFQIIPTIDDYAIGLSIGQEFYRKLGIILEKKFGKENVVLGDEAGYSCPFKDNEEALEIIYELILEKKYPLKIGLDVAGSQYFKDGKYILGEKEYSKIEILDYYESLISRYEIISIEDPFEEEDFDSFAKITIDLNGFYVDKQGVEQKMPEVLVITDDLTTTNPVRLIKAIENKSGNAILIKLTQIGSVSETMEVIAEAYKNNWKIIVSHRSGETMDDFIADLARGSRAWGIKAGAPGRIERMVKYNRLLETI